MLEKPDVRDEALAACLLTHYGLRAASLRFLPVGYDPNASVYEVIAEEGTAYFLKIRAGEINKTALFVPRALLDAGVPHILAPLQTRTQELWCSLEPYTVVLYPFVRGENAMKVGLSDSQWLQFGAALKAVHSSGLAARMRGQIPVETFSLPSGAVVRHIQAQIQGATFDSPSAARLAAFWAENARHLQELVERAETLGRQLQARTFEFVLCHADIHAANILVGEEGQITLVDWDGPLIAPRERDLLFVVGSVIARRVELREEALFFQSYGKVEVDRTALAYYRYERAIEDIGEVGRSVFLNPALSEQTKAEEVELALSLFTPGNIVESAREADRSRS